MQKSRWHPQTMDLSGARVLITGATSGIGKACAFRFQELGCQLILIGRDEGKLQALGVELAQDGQQFQQEGHDKMHELIRLDVCDIDRIQQLSEHVGSIDILINNAGCNLGCEPADRTRKEDLENMVSTNYLAPMAFVSAFAPMMKHQGSGHIINVCSTAAHDIYPKSSVYCSTKAALQAYTVAARHDLVDTPIRVTSISPGLVDTPLHEKKVGSYEQARKTFDGIVPLYPEDIADQIIYVTTRAKHVQVADLASYATNQSHSGAAGIPGVARMGPSLGQPRVEDERNMYPTQNMRAPMSKESERDRYDSYPPHNTRGPTLQESEKDRYDSYNSGNMQFYGQSNGGTGGSHQMPGNGGSHASTPTNYAERMQYPERNQMNDGPTVTEPSRYLSRYLERTGQSDLQNNNKKYGNNQNGYMGRDDGSGMLPGQMPDRSSMSPPRDRNSYQQDRDRSSHRYQQNHNNHMSPQQEYRNTRSGPNSPRSGPNFNVRHV